MDMDELKKRMIQRSAGLSVSASKLPPPPPLQSSKPTSPPPPQSPPIPKPQNEEKREVPKGPLPPNSFDNFDSKPLGARVRSSVQIPKSVLENSFKTSQGPGQPLKKRSTSDPKDLKEMSDSINKSVRNSKGPSPVEFELEAKNPQSVSFGDFSVGLQRLFGNDSSIEYCFTSSRDYSVFIKGSSDVFPLGDLCFLPIYLYALEELKSERLNNITGCDFYSKDKHFIPSENPSNPLTPGGCAAILIELMKDRDLLEKILDKMSDSSGSRISCSLPRFFELEDSEMYSKLSALLHLLKSKGNMKNARVKDVVNLLLSLYSMEWSLSAASNFAATLSNFGDNPSTSKRCFNPQNVQRSKQTILTVGEMGNEAPLYGIYGEEKMLLIIIPREGGIAIKSPQLNPLKAKEFLNKIVVQWPQFKIIPK